MRMDEFSQSQDTSLPFDVVDDVCVFMKNDPVFFRKSFSRQYLVLLICTEQAKQLIKMNV